MALDKDKLGTDLYNKADNYNNKPIDQNDLEANRLGYWIDIADVIINHFRHNGEILVPGQSPGIIN